VKARITCQEADLVGVETKKDRDRTAEDLRWQQPLRTAELVFGEENEGNIHRGAVTGVSYIRGKGSNHVSRRRQHRRSR
jgi:hypothetical protein